MINTAHTESQGRRAGFNCQYFTFWMFLSLSDSTSRLICFKINMDRFKVFLGGFCHLLTPFHFTDFEEILIVYIFVLKN